jgi:hypothetical protein
VFAQLLGLTAGDLASLTEGGILLSRKPRSR